MLYEVSNAAMGIFAFGTFRIEKKSAEQEYQIRTKYIIWKRENDELIKRVEFYFHAMKIWTNAS